MKKTVLRWGNRRIFVGKEEMKEMSGIDGRGEKEGGRNKKKKRNSRKDEKELKKK